MEKARALLARKEKHLEHFLLGQVEQQERERKIIATGFFNGLVIGIVLGAIGFWLIVTLFSLFAPPPAGF